MRNYNPLTQLTQLVTNFNDTILECVDLLNQIERQLTADKDKAVVKELIYQLYSGVVSVKGVADGQ